MVNLREAIRDFGYQQSAVTDIFEDNLAYITMSETPVRRNSSRHIDIRRYLVRELAKTGIVKLIPFRIHKIVADTLTVPKRMPSPACIAHRKVMLGQVPFSLKFVGGCRGRTSISARKPGI